MIVNFKVRNFGSIRTEQTLSFEASKSEHLSEHYLIENNLNLRLLKLGLIYGANASGKTTILRALDFMRDLVIDPAEKKTDELEFYPFLFDGKSRNESTSLSLDFVVKNRRYIYSIEFKRKCIISEKLDVFDPTKANIFERFTNPVNEFVEIKFARRLKISKKIENALKNNTIWNNTVLGGYLKTNVELEVFKDLTEYFQDYLAPIVYSDSIMRNYVNHKLKSLDFPVDLWIEVLKQADFNISGMKIGEEKAPDGLEDFLKEKMGLPESEIDKIINNPPAKFDIAHKVGSETYFLPLDQESEGTKRYLDFSGLLCLLIATDISVPIDELESSLHPELFTHFLLSFLSNSKRSQLIATTHYRELLRDEDLFRDDALWITEKPNKCETELYSFSDFSSDVLRSDANRYNAYKSGRLGGVPNLGDYYIDFNNGSSNRK